MTATKRAAEITCLLLPPIDTYPDTGAACRSAYPPGVERKGVDVDPFFVFIGLVIAVLGVVMLVRLRRPNL